MDLGEDVRFPFADGETPTRRLADVFRPPRDAAPLCFAAVFAFFGARDRFDGAPVVLLLLPAAPVRDVRRFAAPPRDLPPDVDARRRADAVFEEC